MWAVMRALSMTRIMTPGHRGGIWCQSLRLLTMALVPKGPPVLQVRLYRSGNTSNTASAEYTGRTYCVSRNASQEKHNRSLPAGGEWATVCQVKRGFPLTHLRSSRKGGMREVESRPGTQSHTHPYHSPSVIHGWSSHTDVH